MDCKCRKCGVELTDKNWHVSRRKGNRRICKSCESKYSREWYCHNRDLTITRSKQWQHENPEKANAKNTRSRRKHGVLAISDNKACASYFGVLVAEGVICQVLKDVTHMPLHNPGYDIICNGDKLVDVKASTRQRDSQTASWRWHFNINRNTIADFFLCLAFDNREDLNPEHLWLIPGKDVNQMQAISISQSTLSKWSRYERSIEKVIDCCDKLRYFEPGAVEP